MSGGARCQYLDWFFWPALKFLVEVNSPEDIRKALRIFQETFLEGIVEFEIPDIDWWRRRRIHLLSASEILVSLRISTVKDISQMGSDENEFNCLQTMNIWVRVLRAGTDKEVETIF